MAGSSMVVQGQVGCVDRETPAASCRMHLFRCCPWAVGTHRMAHFPWERWAQVRAPVTLAPLPRLTPVVTHTREWLVSYVR